MSQLIPVDGALALIRANAVAQHTETLPLRESLGRKLAEPISAKVSRPPAAVSAMDGYAVRLIDVAEAGSILSVIGEAPAGTPFDTPVKQSQAVRIFTGGELPPGADHVIPQEATQRDGDTVKIQNAYTQTAHVRQTGVDFSEGAHLLSAGTHIGPAELAIAASANHATLSVYKRPKVALLSNGDELRQPGSTLERGQIISSNPTALSALITQWGGEPLDLGIASDSIASIQSHIAQASGADIIVPIGGASVGDHDHMRAAFAGLGYDPIFEKIAVKPGKPTWFSAKNHQRVLGLPGNPASALVCAHLFLAPLINPDKGHTRRTALLGAPLKENGPRTSYLRAHLEISDEGALVAHPAGNQDSSLLTPFLTANCLIYRDAGASALAPGRAVQILIIGPI